MVGLLLAVLLNDGWMYNTSRAQTGDSEDYLPLIQKTFNPNEVPDWWQPAPGTSWQWQLTGAIDTSINVVMYDLDLFDLPQTTLNLLHGQGRTVLSCSWQKVRSASNSPDSFS